MSWSLAMWSEMVMNAPMFAASELNERDVDEAAELHAHAFAQAWSGDELAALLGQPGVFGYAVRRPAQPQAPLLGFALARLAADEAEILTVAVAAAARGRGLGRLLMDRVLERLHAERAAALFLEVEEGNAAALKLYRRLRFEEVGRRPAYYVNPDGSRASALIMKRPLGAR